MNEKWQQITVEIIEDFFINNGITYSQYDNVGLWLTRYYNFRLKFIPIKSWRLRVSKELSYKLVNHLSQSACFEIFHKASTGQNLNLIKAKNYEM